MCKDVRDSRNVIKFMVYSLASHLHGDLFVTNFLVLVSGSPYFLCNSCGPFKVILTKQLVFNKNVFSSSKNIGTHTYAA